MTWHGTTDYKEFERLRLGPAAAQPVVQRADRLGPEHLRLEKEGQEVGFSPCSQASRIVTLTLNFLAQCPPPQERTFGWPGGRAADSNEDDV